MRADRVEKLLQMQEPELNTGCSLWLGFVRPDGYGMFWDGEENRAAHRLAWAVANGPIPAGMCVMHRCDTRACVNPDHLSIGSVADNNADRVRKGRSSGGAKIGTDNPSAKLDPEKVRAVRQMLADGEPLGRIARVFGVNRAQIVGIAKGRRWVSVS